MSEMMYNKQWLTHVLTRQLNFMKGQHEAMVEELDRLDDVGACTELTLEMVEKEKERVRNRLERSIRPVEMIIEFYTKQIKEVEKDDQ